MKAIMVMFDSLNRHMLPPYGCDWVKAPNFERLAEKTVTFSQNYIGSMPCMPARRDLHTGRYNFLHRSWGPLEPFDNSMPEILKKHGVHTHLVSDHYHYWEDGGSTYHSRYSTWENIRGQEGDQWKGQVKEPPRPDRVIEGSKPAETYRQDWVNRQYMPTPDDHPQTVTFDKGIEFIRKNQTEDQWFVQIETFDPHEPFYSHQDYKELYPHDYDGPHFDWPDYKPVTESAEEIEHVRYEYASLLSMCDQQLGRVLDIMDEQDLWKDTMLIVTTDHGFLLGEHGWWGKVKPDFYNEVANTPLFIWDPRSARQEEWCDQLVQMIDIAPTLLDYFKVPIPEEMQGVPLGETIHSNKHVRKACLFGVHGMQVNCTDGRHVYMRAPVDPVNENLYEYTLMPTRLNSMFSVEELQDIELSEPFSFTKGWRTMKIKSKGWDPDKTFRGHLLFDLKKDPSQSQPIEDPETEQQMIDYMVELMEQNDAPVEQFKRIGLENTSDK